MSNFDYGLLMSEADVKKVEVEMRNERLSEKSVSKDKSLNSSDSNKISFFGKQNKKKQQKQSLMLHDIIE